MTINFKPLSKYIPLIIEFSISAIIGYFLFKDKVYHAMIGGIAFPLLCTFVNARIERKISQSFIITCLVGLFMGIIIQKVVYDSRSITVTISDIGNMKSVHDATVSFQSRCIEQTENGVLKRKRGEIFRKIEQTEIQVLSEAKGYFKRAPIGFDISRPQTIKLEPKTMIRILDKLQRPIHFGIAKTNCLCGDFSITSFAISSPNSRVRF